MVCGQSEEDWSLIDKLSKKIQDAKNLIEMAETQLECKYDSVIATIHEIEDKLNKSAESVTPEPSLTDKELFRKIARLTHPDMMDNTDLFIQARKALKSGNREKLVNILTEVESSYSELLAIRQAEYKDVISSNKYLLALDWFSGDFKRQTKASSFYLQVLMNNLKTLQSQL